MVVPTRRKTCCHGFKLSLIGSVLMILGSGLIIVNTFILGRDLTDGKTQSSETKINQEAILANLTTRIKTLEEIQGKSIDANEAVDNTLKLLKEGLTNSDKKNSVERKNLEYSLKEGLTNLSNKNTIERENLEYSLKEGLTNLSNKNTIERENLTLSLMKKLSNMKTLVKTILYTAASCIDGGWTLIARFSNTDSMNWMMSSGEWWYDRSTSYGSTTSTSDNSDMISEAFWKISGSEIKITRSDDSSNTALLRTYTNCVGGRTFRSFITSYGNFRNGAIWSNDQCLGSCPVYYGGHYTSTSGFQYYSCSSNIQSANYIGFWCDWSGGDGAVMMIGGGGSTCGRADHGIGITEENEAKFGLNLARDFGNEHNSYTSLYSLNLWIR